ncbi:MAG: glycosyltransferase [Ignavibacteriaceae bacterium]|jgi:glycosyltransferase involved in cell wall biosynthesis|nr:glycosyltransferase [Ignavibacteriaceae bacterium]MCW9065799.1 glycosyltransferase [Ignavibacteriaceae bacterium]
MKQPLVSVIISTYNSEEFIKGRLDNLIEQTIFNDIEIIIVNSGSEQNEERIIIKYTKLYPNIKYIKTENRESVYNAWNRGIKISKGEYITNANTDDRLRDDALGILSEALNKNPDKAIVYADQYITNIPNASFKDIKLINKKKKFNRLNYSRLNQLSGYIAGPQSMWRSSLHFRDNIWFDETFEVSGDNDFVCRVAEKYDLMRVSGVLGIYFKSVDNSNREFRNFEETYEESLKVKEKYLRRYLRNLTPNEKKKLLRKIYLYKKTPHILISIISKIIHLINPAMIIPRREFMFLVASTFEELEGNNEKAIEYCKVYITRTVDSLMKRQYNHLITRS